MNSDAAAGSDSSVLNNKNGDQLSYKFQRLRERLREAVRVGEFVGKLPGERTLARRFHVNAKTLSKALTDLAAEGLLDRSIGRGTYVKNGSPTEVAKATRWLIYCDADRNDSAIVRLFKQANGDVTVINSVSGVRPSFLRQFDAVIDFGSDTPEAFIRDLVVRNVPLVSVNREPGLFSLNSVNTDRALGGTYAARDVFLAGHRDVAVVQSMARSAVPGAVTQAAERYAPDARVRTVTKADVVAAVRDGATAIICDSTEVGFEVRPLLEAAGLRTPEDVSVMSVGCCGEEYPSSGYFADVRQVVQNVADMLRGGTNHRPTSIWLAPHRVERGTVRVLGQASGGAAV